MYVHKACILSNSRTNMCGLQGEMKGKKSQKAVDALFIFFENMLTVLRYFSNESFWNSCIRTWTADDYYKHRYIDIITTSGVCDYRRVMVWWMDFLPTCIHHSELHFTDHWHTQTSILNLLQSSLAVSLQLHVITDPLLIFTLYNSPQHPLSLFPASNSRSLATALTVKVLQLPGLTSLLSGEYLASELLSTVSSTIAPSLLGLSCRARLNYQPSTELSHSPTNYFTSFHFTSLNWTGQLNCLQENSSERTTQKTQPSTVVEECLSRRCIAIVAARITWKTPFFYFCVRVCCGRYLAAASVYRVTA
jgi:hypothetical protein